MEIAMQITRKKRGQASGNQAVLSPLKVLSPSNGELITPPLGIFPRFFAFQVTVS